ncbi:MAG: CRTAC1 family protein [Planctomycetes bacterium]|nr:CRTAC1 family protein [Planctomycetota bacterium]
MSEREQEYVPADDAIIGVAFKWSLGVIAVVAVVVVAVVLLRRQGAEAPAVIEREAIVAPDRLDQDAEEMPVVGFTDVTTGAGIGFVHESGATGEKLLPESMGGGCAFLDHDGDGDQDLLLVNAMPWPHDAGEAPAPTMALYRNDGAGAFTDVTAGSGLDVACHGMGVATADADGDGDADVYVTALGPNRLFRNDGGRFTEVPEAGGAAGGADRWSTSAGFFDADGDGDLDLFVCNYVAWSREQDVRLNFTLNGTDRAYGPPKLYEGTHCSLYRNDGSGAFTDVSAASGIEVSNPATGKPMGKALAVTFVDVDDDGDLDILVANDTVQNFVFRNDGGGVFEEIGAVSGVAFDTMGTATGAMGMDAGDLRNDGRLGVGIANFANESTSLYVQQERDPWQFADMSGAEGIGSPSRLKLSFGLFFFDYDLDGRLDMLQANGHLEDTISEIQPSQTYRQPAQLFWNRGPGARSCFAAVPEDTLGDLARPVVGRAAAYADIDEDGDLDVVITETGDRPMLLRNDQDLGHRWVRLKLVGGPGNRDAIGARIDLTAGGVTQRRTVMPTRSYLSQMELPLTFGLGDAESVEGLTIRWPDGTRETRSDVPVGKLAVIRRSSS